MDHDCDDASALSVLIQDLPARRIRAGFYLRIPLVQRSPADTYDLVLVGSGFAASFFLHRYLALGSPRVRVLVLERGEVRSHAWQMENDGQLDREAQESFTNRHPSKSWLFRLAFGGGSNCWWACTPRFLPEDFQLQSTYGVGTDWPITYDQLEESYSDAEDLMEVSGPSDDSPFPRSRPYPLPAHRLSDPDRLLKASHPSAFFALPTARPSRATVSGRPRCCASGVCALCPIDSKFTILNTFQSVYADPRVTLVTDATALAVEVSASRATGVRYRRNGTESIASGSVVGLGANAVFNPYLLLRSGLAEGGVGEGLAEQISARVDVMLNGVDNYQGSTSITGHGYMLYGGAHRRDRAAALMESWNIPNLRDERGKWRQRLTLKFLFEDLRGARNRVVIDPNRPDRPQTLYEGPSAYLDRGIKALDSALPRVLNGLPVERYAVHADPRSSEAHILGTTAMGRDARTSVIDADLVHHRVRNLLILGGSTFPTITPSNPTLTICALSLRAASRLLASQS